jgi:hypothetical protein
MWKFFTNLGKCFGKRPVVRPAADEVGISIASSDSPVPLLIRWDEIDEIHTFKLDLGTFDEIRLALHDSSGWHELSEQDDGFMEIAADLQRRYPAIPEAWYLEVMFPAFEKNHRVLWKCKEPDPEGRDI